MDAQQNSGASPSTATPFEDPRFQGLSVPASVELLLVTLDQCRNQLDGVPLPTVSRDYQELIPAKERKLLDSAIALFWRDYEDRGVRELKRLGVIDDSPGDPVYPLAMETALTVENIALAKIKAEVSDEHLGTYIRDPVKAEYIMVSMRLGTKAQRESILGSAFLPLIVSKLEEFIAALVRVTLTLHENALGELPSVPNSIVKQYRSNVSTSDLLRWQIDQKVTSLLKGSPSNWRDEIARRTRLDIAAVGADWEIITEIIQRRHAIVHNGGRVDDEYIARVPERLRFGLDNGSPLICGHSYMNAALVEVETWALCISVNWVKHFFKDEARYYPLIINRVVELERQGRWTHGLAVLEAYLREPRPDTSEVSYAQINRWLCIQQLGRSSDALEREIREWKPQGLDSKDKFRFDLGRAALLKDYDEVIRMLRSGLGSETLGLQKKVVREMPLFKRAMTESPNVARILQGPDRQTIRTASNPQHHGKGARKRR